MLYDVHTRNLVADERSELLRRQAALSTREPRVRRWLADRLIGVAFRIAPACDEASRLPAQRLSGRAV
jgi:hypothetical protein